MTYSVIARDPDSSLMGIATMSHDLAVGSSVPWTSPGWGVIATQSVGEPFYGDLGLDLLAGGLTADEALVALRSVDEHPERRQVAMLDAAGRIAAYTGESCIAAAGHVEGDGWCALGNMVAGPEVWEAMAEALAAEDGSLPRRLLAALAAGTEAGGDVRGARSAALSVVRAERTGRPWRDWEIELRVDDVADPTAELARLVGESERHRRAVHAFDRALDGDPDGAAAELDDLADDADPHRVDHMVWHVVALALAGRHDAAVDELVAAAGRNGDVVEVAERYGSVPPPIGPEGIGAVVAEARRRLGA